MSFVDQDLFLKLVDGSAHDIIYAILEERRKAEAIRKKQLPVGRAYPSQSHQVTPRKNLTCTTKALQDDFQVVNPTKYFLPPAIPITIKPISNPLKEIARLQKEAIRLENAHTTLRKLVSTMHPMPSLAPDRSISRQQNVLNLLDNLVRIPVGV